MSGYYIWWIYQTTLSNNESPIHTSKKRKNWRGLFVSPEELAGKVQKSWRQDFATKLERISWIFSLPLCRVLRIDYLKIAKLWLVWMLRHTKYPTFTNYHDYNSKGRQVNGLGALLGWAISSKKSVEKWYWPNGKNLLFCNTRWFWKNIGYGSGIAKNYRVGSGIGYPSVTEGKVR